MAVKTTRRAVRRPELATLACGLLLGATVSPLTGQTAPTRPSDPDGPPPSTQAASQTRPATVASPATVAAAATKPIDGLNAKDLTVDAVLQQLSESAGYIIQKEAKDARLDERVTVLSRQSMTPDELIAAVNTTLKPDGFTVLQRGRTLLVVARAGAIKGDIPVHFGSDPALIQENDNLITQVIPVRTLDAVKLKTDLIPLTEADLTSNAAGNAIIMTDTSANIRRIVQIIHDLDQHQAAVSDMRVVRLKYADADAAAKLVTTVFGPDAGQSQNPVAQRLQFIRAFRGGRGGGGGGGGGPFGGGPGGGGPGGGGAADESEGSPGGKVVAAADTRTNTVVITGPTETVQLIVDMLKELDASPASESTFFMFRLKNGQAINMAATLNNLFSNGTNSTSNLNNNNTNNRNTGTGGTNSAFAFNGSGGGGGGRGGGGGAFGTGGNNNNRATNTPFQQNQTGSQLGGNQQRVTSELTGQVYVVADQDTNSLLVTTATKYEKQVRAIITDLDRPVPQVLIKVLVAEVTHDSSADFGTDFSILNTRPNTLGQSFNSTFGQPGSGLVVSFVENKLNATLHALAQQNKLDVLSRPYILASDNQASEILVGEEVPLVTNNYTTSLGQIVSNYTYQKVGIIVDVTPHINPDGLVTLDVAPEISQLTPQTVSVGPGVNAPVISDRSASSRVAIRDGQTIVIGGLMQDQKTKTINKIPILGDIPLIGVAFSRTQVDVTKTELLIFLTPHVAQNADVLSPMSKDEMKGTQLTPTAVAPGTFQEHMRGLQRGSTQPARDRQ